MCQRHEAADEGNLVFEQRQLRVVRRAEGAQIAPLISLVAERVHLAVVDGVRICGGRHQGPNSLGHAGDIDDAVDLAHLRQLVGPGGPVIAGIGKHLLDGDRDPTAPRAHETAAQRANFLARSAREHEPRARRKESVGGVVVVHFVFDRCMVVRRQGSRQADLITEYK